MGDASYFDELLGQPILVSEKMKQVMVKSLVSRCQNLEQKLPKEPNIAGLFARIAQRGHHLVDVVLSSKHDCCKDSDPHEVLSRSHKKFGTTNQSEQPWIELMMKTKDFVIRPTSVGLRPGSDECDKYQQLVVEAAFEDNSWCPILVVLRAVLLNAEAIYPISEKQFKGKLFNRFRIRM